MNDLKQTYYSTLPDKVRVMAEKGSSSITSKRHAHRFPWLAPNHSETRWLIVDVDKPVNPFYAIYDAHLPDPNLVSTNRDNGHSQFFWLLSEPVYSWHSQKYTPAHRYLDAVNDAFDKRLDGDPHFRRCIAKNPFHHRWDTSELHSEGFKLSDLAEWVNLSRKEKIEVDEVEGRNMGLFNTLRFWAYKNYLTARAVSFDSWLNQVTTRAFALNTFERPLSIAEVRSVASSVARYVYFKYEPQANRGRDLEVITLEMDVKERQRLSAERTNAARKGATAAKIEWAVRRLIGSGKRVTKASVARESGVDRKTVSRFSHLLPG